eukprot:6995486-Pyramimonas_sp.AAC.1
MLISITETLKFDQYSGQNVRPQQAQAWANAERINDDLQRIQIDGQPLNVTDSVKLVGRKVVALGNQDTSLLQKRFDDALPKLTRIQRLPLSIADKGEQARALIAAMIAIGMDLALPPQKTMGTFRRAAFNAICPRGNKWICRWLLFHNGIKFHAIAPHTVAHTEVPRALRR